VERPAAYRALSGFGWSIRNELYTVKQLKLKFVFSHTQQKERPRETYSRCRLKQKWSLVPGSITGIVLCLVRLNIEFNFYDLTLWPRDFYGCQAG
jgi:hypothetical protein